MLQKIHDIAKGWLAYIIVGLLIIPFALWGINHYFGAGGERIAATVNGAEISVRDVQTAVREQKDRLRGVFGGRLPAGLAEDAVLREVALEGLIREQLLRQRLEHGGYRVSDMQVFTELTKIEAFQEEGRFSPARYERLLSAQRLTKSAFESRIRAALALDQLQTGVIGSAFAPLAYGRDYQRLEGQTREIAYALFRASDYAEGLEPDEEDLRAYYEAHQDEFMSAERVRVAYVELDQERIAATLPVTEEDLRAYYEEQAARFRSPARRRVSHILIKLPVDADEQAVAAARARAEALEARLRAGEDFAVLAREASEDSLTAAQGGDLGYVHPGDIGPLFDQALEALSEGEISAPVRTEFGFHILKLTEFEPPQQQSFEQVREQVEQEYRRQQAENIFYERTEELANAAYENPGSLQPAADAVGAEIQTSEWMTREAGSGIGTHSVVREAAFSDDVLMEGQNSELLEIDAGRVVVLRLLDHRPAALQPLEKVRDQVRAKVLQRQAAERARQAGEAALARLREGLDMEQALQETKAVLKRVGFVGRRNTEVPAALLRKAFTLDAPDGGRPVYSGLPLSGGDYGLIALSAVRDGEPGEAGEAASRLQAAYGSRELEAYVRALEARAEIERFPENF